MATNISILPSKVDYELWKGDTWEPGTITASISGVPVNFTGYTAKMEIRNAISNSVVLTLENGSGITLSTVGVITIVMTAVQTAALIGDYNYDLQITDTSSKKRTYTYGTIGVTADTTDN